MSGVPVRQEPSRSGDIVGRLAGTYKGDRLEPRRAAGGSYAPPNTKSSISAASSTGRSPWME